MTLDREIAIPAAAIDDFRRNGHVLVRGAMTREETTAWHEAIAGAVERQKALVRGGVYAKSLHERDAYHRSFLQVENLWQLDPAIRPFSLARRFGRIAADLLGVDAVRLYHDQALFKEPGGGHTAWHQDQYYWPLDTDKTVTMWLALVDVSIEMGSLVFADGSHKLGPLAMVPISEESERLLREEAIGRNLRLTINELRAGDATWHHGWTLHKATGNSSARMRAAMTLIFVADGARVSEWKTEKHPREAAKWLPGLGPGDLVDSPLNPLVYTSS